MSDTESVSSSGDDVKLRGSEIAMPPDVDDLALPDPEYFFSHWAELNLQLSDDESSHTENLGEEELRARISWNEHYRQSLRVELESLQSTLKDEWFAKEKILSQLLAQVLDDGDEKTTEMISYPVAPLVKSE